MSAIDKLTPGGFTPASVIEELRAELIERDALRRALADLWVVAKHHVADHTLGGELMVRRVTALLTGLELSGPGSAFRICDAYESGLGHGLKCDGAVNPYTHGAEREAYDIGYRRGEDHREQMRAGPRALETI